MTDQPQYKPGKARPGGNPPVPPPQGVPAQPRPDGLLPAADPWIADSETVRATRDDLFAAPSWEEAPSWEAAPTEYVEDPAYSVAAPFHDEPPQRRRTGLISTIIVLVLLAAVAGGYFALHDGSSGKDNSAGLHPPTTPAGVVPSVTVQPSASTPTTAPAGGAVTPSATPSPSPSPKDPASCAIGTWTLTAETITEDSSLFGVGSGPITLTAEHPNETRIFFPDHTGKIDVVNTYTGTASDGTPVSVLLTGTGATFDYTYDGTTVTYTRMFMPGTFEVDVDGVQKSISYRDPLYQLGSAAMHCSGNTLTQHGDGYSRTYTRKPL